jgi:putative lipase involved disintegration of autophagic bodies
MNKKQLRKEIQQLIDSIKKHSDELAAMEHIPQLELELILSKVERLHDKSVIYNYLHSVSATDEDEKETDKKIETKTTESLQNEETDTIQEAKKEDAPQVQKTKPEFKSLIGLNQKFQFAAELFKNNQADFSEVLQKINDCKNIKEAHNALNDVRQKYNWKDDSKTTEAFIALVKKYFS